MTSRRRAAALAVAAVLLVIGVAAYVAPSFGANAILYPKRRPMTRQPNHPFEAVEFDGAGVKLNGWWFHTAEKRGTVVFLHGVGDNRGSAVGIAGHFLPHGFEVIAYDSRAHGESGGDVCTYGFYEKEDLRRVLDRVTVNPIVAMGVSMGAAVALEAAAEDRRIAAVVAVSSFSDLHTAAAERAPFFATTGALARTFERAGKIGKFRVDEVSPMAAAVNITAPTLLIHGDHDDETPPAHSQRIFAALSGPKRLILVPNARHSHVLDAGVWHEIDDWLDAALPRPSEPPRTAPNEGGAQRAPAGAGAI